MINENLPQLVFLIVSISMTISFTTAYIVDLAFRKIKLGSRSPAQQTTKHDDI